MPPSTEPVHKGTLVCVVLKARNLPNKKSIGKQDPYTVLSMGQEQQKTRPDKRGGQHPTWDEQLHFEVYEDMEDALTATSTNGTGSGSGSKATSATKAKGGKKVLKVACYADDSKEPEFIGEGLVDLTETLQTGEFDEWVTIKAKDRYAGEVYLELTFYSSAAPPKKQQSRPSSQPMLSGSDTYGGAGSFSRLEDGSASPPKPNKPKGDHPPIPASMRPGGTSAVSTTHNRMSSSISSSSLAATLHRAPSAMSHSQTMHDLGSTTLRPSSSLANLDAYTPAYAPASISRSTSPVPPSSSYHSVTAAAGGSRRNSFATPMPSEFGHSITPSASYYSQHSMAPSQSSQYIAHGHAVEPSDDRYATVRPATISQHHHHHHQQQQQQQQQQYSLPRPQSVSQIPIAYKHTQQPDFGADQLTQSLSKMGFGHSTATLDKPLPPPTPVAAEERPPQSHIYQAPAHLASLYTPPPNAGFEADVQRPVSPAARPASALSQYSTSLPAHVNASTPSVVNAQTYYQQQQQQQQQPQPQPQPPPPAPQASAHLAQPPSIPARSSSPAAPTYTPIVSPYSQPPQQAHVPRPLPSTQSSTSLASAAPAPQPSQPQPQPQPPPQPYASHLYQQVAQPSATAPHQPHQLSHSQSHSGWHGGLASGSQAAQPSYAPAPATHTNAMASMPSGYVYSSAAAHAPTAPAEVNGWAPGRSASPLPPIPGSQQSLPQSQPSLHLGAATSFYAHSPAPLAYAQHAYPPYTPPQHAYAQPAQPAQPAGGYPHYAAPPHGASGPASHPAHPALSSSALYQSHQLQYASQQYQ